MSSLSTFVVSPPPALAASRARRQRSNAFSRARESEAEWDSTPVAADTSASPTAPSSSPWRDDELICPLALDAQRTHADPHAHANANAPSWIPVPVWPADQGELQAVLSQFAFPTSGRKHRRSGEMISDNSPTSPSCSAAPTPAVGSGKRRTASGPTRRAWCPHCERGRSSA